MKQLYVFEEPKKINEIIGSHISVVKEMVNGVEAIKRITPKGWKDLNSLLQVYYSKLEETFRYILVSSDGEIKEQLSICSHMPNFCNVSKPNDETLKQVISKLEEDNLFLLVTHNHPSGNTAESSFDRELTESLAKSLRRNDGLSRFIGHIIPDKTSYNYCNRTCRWKKMQILTTRVADVCPYPWAVSISGTATSKSIAARIKGKTPLLVFTNADRYGVAAKRVKLDSFMADDSEHLRAKLTKQAMKVGAIGSILLIPKGFDLTSDLVNRFKELVLGDVFTDVAWSSSTITEHCDVPAGSVYVNNSTRGKLTINSTWTPTINKRLFPIE